MEWAFYLSYPKLFELSIDSSFILHGQTSLSRTLCHRLFAILSATVVSESGFPLASCLTRHPNRHPPHLKTSDRISEKSHDLSFMPFVHLTSGHDLCWNFQISCWIFILTNFFAFTFSPIFKVLRRVQKNRHTGGSSLSHLHCLLANCSSNLAHCYSLYSSGK